MSRTDSRMRNFARLLACYETARKGRAEPSLSSGAIVCERLRLHLSTLMGEAGFEALYSRAEALADVKMGKKADPAAKPASSGQRNRGGLETLAQLLCLLAAFIGETLTVQIVRELWPQVSYSDLEIGGGVKNEKAN